MHDPNGILIFTSSSVTLRGSHPHWFRTLTNHSARSEIGFVTPRVMDSSRTIMHYGKDYCCMSSSERTTPADNAFGQLELPKSAQSISSWMFTIRIETYRQIKRHCTKYLPDTLVSLDLMAEVCTQLGFRNIAIPCDVIVDKNN
jgi:hypothetical protein